VFGWRERYGYSFSIQSSFFIQELTMSTISVMSLLFIVFLGGLAVMIWVDRKKVYILPPKLNHDDGGQASSEGNTSAEYKANTKNGDLIINVAADGKGTASAWAAVGYEQENETIDNGMMLAHLSFKYRIKLNTDNGSSPVNAKIEAFLNSESVSFTEKSLTATPGADEKSSNEFVSGTQTVKANLQLGERFTIYLKVSLDAEAGEGGKCSGEIVATVTEIFFRPEMKPF
jgi:hypothetical protein